MARASQERPAVPAAGSGLAQALADLQLASITDLCARFRQLYRRAAPDGMSRDLVARLVAHRLQEQRLGGLDRDLAAQLDRLARGRPAGRRLKPGTVLVREYEGVTHEVVTVHRGFVWNGETFTSLSTIAKRVTGTSWNGPRFFGLRSNRSNTAEGGSYA
ncbi:DUF2924 domain-containing protein [Bosea sp. (in: a-proteobacteria)]|jgi:hypothetical protein|uniref:DUF2924 domain-containing protein n=1 Tax=Bosea sp. (in: a-proteobacteria) TaxID=1871050 RepID=UPI003F70EBA9